MIEREPPAIPYVSSARREGSKLEHVSSSASTEASQNLVDGVDGTLGSPIAARDGEEAIQKGVLRIRGLESGCGPEVVGRRVDSLAARERRHRFRWSVTKPEGRH